MKQPDRALQAALNPFFDSHGFKFLKSRKVYIRKTALGFNNFMWSCYPLATGPKWKAGYYEGSFGVGIKSDKVAEIFDVLNLTHGDDNKRYRPTAYRGVGAIGGYFAFDPTRDRELCLRFDHLEGDVAETMRRIETMLEADGLAWYDRYADPVALSRDINDPLDGLNPHHLVNNINHRPLVGIAAACVGEPERVSSLVDGWLSVVRGWDEQYADQRPSQADDFAKKFALITDKARELGYSV